MTGQQREDGCEDGVIRMIVSAASRSRDEWHEGDRNSQRGEWNVQQVNVHFPLR